MSERQNLMMLSVLGVFPLNMELFLSIQIHQLMSAIMDLVPLRAVGAATSMAILTLAEVVGPSFHTLGCKAEQPTHVATILHTCMVVGQSHMRCTELSRLPMHGQKYPFGHPRRCSLSLHHNRFRWSSHMNILFLPAAPTPSR